MSLSCKIKNLPLKSWLSLFCVLIFFKLNAQHPAYKQYTISDGLPSSEVYYVIQDSKGYIWFCTANGISKFDSYIFKNFSTEDGLPENSVFELYEDKKHRIWTRTQSCKLAYIVDDSVKQLSADPKLRNNSCSFLVQDNGEILMGYYKGKGITSIAQPYTDFSDHISIPLGYYIYRVNAEQFIYGFASKETGVSINKLNYFNGTEKKRIDWDPIRGGYNSFKCIQTGKNKFLISTSFFLFEIENGEIISNREMKHEIIHISKDKKGGLWIGTIGGGALYYSSGSAAQINPQHYFGNDNISCVLTDKEGGLWVSSTTNGVYYISSPSLSVLNNENGLPENNIVNIEKFNDTCFIIAEKNMGLSLISASGKLIKNFHVSGKSYNDITSTKKITETKILVNSVIHDLTGKISKPLLYNNKPFFTRKAIVSDGIITGVSYSFIYKYDVNSQQIKFIPVSFRVMALAQQKDTIWLGCSDGLRYMIDTVIFDARSRNNFFKTSINDIFIAGNSMYLATKGEGLIIVKGNKIIRLNKASGLKSSFCSVVTVDQNNNIWLVTNEGISKIRSENGTNNIENIGSGESLPSLEIKQLLCMNNRIFAASNSGLIILKDTSSAPVTYHVPVYITAVLLNNITLITPNALLNYDQNYLSFDFVGLSYKKNKKQLYRYSLEGLNGGYKFTSATSVQYPALPSGNYSFKVTVVDDKQNVIGETASYDFVIKKPLWKETWFILLSIAVIIGVLMVFVKQKIKQEKQKAALKTKIAETELKALRAQMNPHFIFNTINSIQNFILKNDKTQAYDYLSRFSQLIRNVLEFSKSEGISLTEEIATLELYMQLEALRFDKQFEYKIETDDSLNAATIHIPSMLIQPYVENAIWHGIMHKEEKGHIIIKISQADENLLRCVIDDDGIGRKRSAELKAKNILKHKSLGMEVTAQRMEIFGKNAGSNTKAEIEDKYDEKGNAAGTRIILLIPILKK